MYADTFGYNTVPGSNEVSNEIQCTKATLSVTGTVTSMSFYSAVSGNVKVGIYGNSGNSPGTLMVGPVEQVGSTAGTWNTVTISPGVLLSAGVYWICDGANTVGATKYDSGVGTMVYKALTYGTAWPSPFGTGAMGAYSDGVYATYSTGPPPSDFTITATPTSQTIGAGGTATSTLSLAAGGGFSGTVTLSVTSGCPPGVTCTALPSPISSYPNTATLTVPTLITTSGTFPVVVTATSGPLSHTATFTVTVTSSATYAFNVRSGATQVVVTVSWAGGGTASVTIAGPSGSPTLSESGAVVYDRTTYVSGSSTPTNIHRVTFTLSSPPTGTWTAYVSQSGAMVTIEVS